MVAPQQLSNLCFVELSSLALVCILCICVCVCVWTVNLCAFAVKSKSAVDGDGCADLFFRFRKLCAFLIISVSSASVVFYVTV